MPRRAAGADPAARPRSRHRASRAPRDVLPCPRPSSAGRRCDPRSETTRVRRRRWLRTGRRSDAHRCRRPGRPRSPGPCHRRHSDLAGRPAGCRPVTMSDSRRPWDLARRASASHGGPRRRGGWTPRPPSGGRRSGRSRWRAASRQVTTPGRRPSGPVPRRRGRLRPIRPIPHRPQGIDQDLSGSSVGRRRRPGDRPPTRRRTAAGTPRRCRSVVTPTRCRLRRCQR